MYTLDIAGIGPFLTTFFGIIGGSLRLDPAVFRTVLTSSQTGATLVPLLLLLLAGTSTALGQSVVLLANKVTPGRFVLSLLLNSALFVLGVIIWAVLFELVGRFFLGVQVSFEQLGRMVGLAYAPLVLSFFVLLPYAGSFLQHVFQVWSFLAVLVAISVTLHLTFLPSLACGLIGWLVTQALHYTVGKPVFMLQTQLRRVVAGVPLLAPVPDLLNVPPEPPEGAHR